MSIFNAVLTSISYDDQGAYEVGFAAGLSNAGVGATARVANAGVGSYDDW